MPHYRMLVCPVLALLLFSFIGGRASADTLSIRIGDDDGFGGVLGSVSNDGDLVDPNLLEQLPDLVPGTYLDVDATDRVSISPWTPYTFEFSFPWDTTSLATIESAAVTIQTASLGKRDSGEPGTGFGVAAVSATDGQSTLPLGDFSSIATGAANSSLEESVELQVYPVADLVLPVATGVLRIVVDGSSVTNPVDLFAIDFAELIIEGTAVPEPATSTLIGLALSAVLASRYIQRFLCCTR